MTVFSGMLVATMVGIIVVPALYVFVERYVAKGSDGGPNDPGGAVENPGGHA